MLDNIKKEFSTRTLVLMPIAIVINIVIGELTTRLKVPIYLDSIGTVLVGAIAGPWAGALTGRSASQSKPSAPTVEGFRGFVMWAFPFRLERTTV